jgi:acetate kinase
MVAHRVVHGGGKYTRPVRIDREVLAELELLVPLAPLHQPYALHAMQILLDELPGLPQVACFDTGFHSTLPLVEQMLPLPHALWERGIRRYGFHGLSYEYLSIALAERHGAHARCRTIVAHLGSGASLCAMQNLQSVATTTGFSALDGLMMGTRCGALDPGVVLHLLEQENYSVEQVSALLYQESGLLGVSGCSSSVKSLLDAEADNPRARTALALYVRRIVREIGALTAVLGGLDLLAFTAGVGERSAELRARICAALQWLGVELDSDANRAGAATISAAGSAVRVAVEPTNEEWIAASHAVHVLRGNAPVAARHALA